LLVLDISNKSISKDKKKELSLNEYTQTH